MEYQFTEAIKKVVGLCENGLDSDMRIEDENGNVTCWLSAKWQRYKDGVIIELNIYFTDTGRLAYSTYLMETYRPLEKVYPVYSLEADMTFIMKDRYNLRGKIISSEVIGFCYGEVEEDQQEEIKKCIGKLKADFTM